jgi:hypothetical protein
MGIGERGYGVRKTYPLGITMSDFPIRSTTDRVSDAAKNWHYARCSEIVPTNSSAAAASASSLF